MTSPKKNLFLKIVRVSEFTGQLCAYLVFILVILIGYDVTMRYLFQNGSVALQELEWHLFSLIFLLGAAYTQKHDAHVRVDVFYRHSRFNDQHRAAINIFGAVFFLIPFCLMVIISSWPFILNAYAIQETSPDPGGLPYRWLLKAVIPLGFSLLLIQAVADILSNLVFLKQSKGIKS